jgi:hypothetical protein
MAVVFQNSPDGVRALGTTGSGLGYTGIPGKKVGYLINIFPGDAQGSGTGVRFDASGAAGGPYNQIDFSRFDETWIDVSLTYDAEAKTLKEVLTWNDGVEDVPIRSATIPNIDLPELLGGNEATLGITVSSGAAYAEQRIQGLDFRSPAAVRPDARPEWQLNGSVQSLANGSLTIPVVPNTVTSTWYGREVSTDGFEAAFTYTVSDWNADVAAFGIAFVLQQSPAGFAAIGASGDALGYADMPGPKAGFLLTVRNGGTAPVLFAGVDDGSGSATSEQLGVLMGPVSVTLSYDAQTRTLSAVVTSTGIAQYTRTWTVDLPQLLGKQAILGITSGTTLFALSTPTQTITNFIFKGRDGIESLKPGGDSTPTVRLWTTHGDIGASGDEINVRGKLQADAPQGEIHTNPPPSPSIRLVREGGRRPDGMLMTNVGRVTVTRSSPDNTILYSVNGGRTWRPRFQAVEGLNDVLVVQVNTRGFRSSPSRLQFVLDRSSPPAPRVTVLQRAGVLSGTGQLSITGLRRQAVVEYSVNGGAWSSTYTPVEGRNVVRIRQTDLAGNRSLPSVVRFVLKTRVGRLIVALRHPDPDRVEPVTSDGKLLIRGRERGAFVQYSTDGGASWRRSFRPALGLNRLAVRQVDRVGNVSEPTAFEFTFEVQTRGGRRLGMAWWLGGKA